MIGFVKSSTDGLRLAEADPVVLAGPESLAARTGDAVIGAMGVTPALSFAASGAACVGAVSRVEAGDDLWEAASVDLREGSRKLSFDLRGRILCSRALAAAVNAQILKLP